MHFCVSRQNWTFILLCVALCTTLYAADSDFQRLFSKKISCDKNTVVILENPIGEVRITNTPSEIGNFAIIKQKVFASGSDLAQSRLLVMQVRMDFTRTKDTLFLEAIFPSDKYDKFAYPEMGNTYSDEVARMWKKGRITVSPKKGTKLWSDISLEVPIGTKVVLKSVATVLIADEFEGDLELFTDFASAMTTGNVHGNFWLSACHGALSVSSFSGELFYDGEDSDLSFCDKFEGTVLAKSTTGNLIWTARGEKLTKLDLSSLSGKILFTGTPASFTTLNNESGIIDIKLSTSNLFDSLFATNKSGEINLLAPENCARNLFAKTTTGTLKTKFTTTTNEINAPMRGERGNFKLQNINGNIKIDFTNEITR